MKPGNTPKEKPEIGVAVLLLATHFSRSSARHCSGVFELVLDAALLLAMAIFAYAHFG